MARPYTSGSKWFVFGAGDDDERRVPAADAQEAYMAFRAFFSERDAETFTVEDEGTGQLLVLMPRKGVIARIDDVRDPRAEYLSVDAPNRYMPSAMLFFENGHRGLDHFGQWFPDLADLDASPEERGRARAATFTTEAARLREVGRIWADSGIVDPSDQYYAFFDGYDLDEDESERVELLVLLDALGIERVDAPEGAAPGEVWVRTEPRLDTEFEKW